MERKQITRIVLIALFAALVAAGAFIKIPLVPAPMTLQTLFMLIASATLPPLMALSSIIVYLLLGTIGLPIFTSGGGLGAMLGPTGGYLVGMIPAVIAGAISIKLLPASHIRISVLISSVISTIFVYAVGIPWLSAKMEIPFAAALASGLIPFIAGDILKIIITSAVAPVVRPRIAELLERE